IAPYERIETEYLSITTEKIPVVFFALPKSVEKARALLPEILDHLRFFESHFGPYPFRNEKYGVAETPFLGMEHQTLIAYGYGFRRERNFDYDWLHHHEASHEWWGNLVTCPDWKDMWIHEGIGTYTQALYIEEKHGMAGYRRQISNWRRYLANDKPVAPRASQNSREIYFSRSGGTDNDIYYKGALVLHTLRYLIGQETLMASLKEMAYPDEASLKATDGSQCRFRTTDDFIEIVNRRAGQDLTWFFDVYLRQPKLPSLQKRVQDGKVSFRWKVPGDLPFPMPIDVLIGDRRSRLEMPEGKASIGRNVDPKEVRVDPDLWVLRQLR
ncbi:MAG: M1 family peptidase, partial [Planctomycetes bacterium]|nr:M1 family peptidase [Planctomycetota bacterium]